MENQTEGNQIEIYENGLHVILEITPDGDVRLLHFSALPFDPHTLEAVLHPDRAAFRLVELQSAGENQDDHHGSKHTGTSPGRGLRYRDHRDIRGENGRKLEVELEREGLFTTCCFQFYDGLPIVRAWTEVENRNSISLDLEYVSSFSITGMAKEGLLPWEAKCRLHVPHNTWTGEAQWRSYRLPDLGLSSYCHWGGFSLKRLSFSATGSWSTSEFLPMGCLENEEAGSMLFWQIENNGSWQWEIGERGFHPYLLLSGPTFSENHWWKRLEPGDRFVSVPVAVGSTLDGFEGAMAALTSYRRAIRRPNPDNERLPVIFNDYMNSLNGDPTRDKELPLIDAAADAGCEYYVIDAGWYAEHGGWWTEVGEWQPAQSRFPNGLQEVLDYIKARGMVPGLWLEIEVMGIHNHLANRLPDDWFFLKRGRRVIDHGRYQLDFSNPQVREWADEVIDRLVGEWGVGYIKMDYNINAGPGTDRETGSLGAGLLEHNRSYLAWLEGVFARYPGLVIENCSSGGMRMDYALLSRHSLQSSSDQSDYRRYAAIAAATPTGAAPEQCLHWSFPLENGDWEETAFNMVNALLGRILQSGHLANLSGERLELVKEGIRTYKEIRSEIRHGLSFWPLGLPTFTDSWISYGLHCGERSFLAVWRLESSEDTISLPIPRYQGQEYATRLLYPQGGACRWRWNFASGRLTVRLPGQNTARIFELS